MRIAVTGATGHLGANLVRLLVADGHSVRALHHGSSRLEAIAGLDLERMPCDVLDIASLEFAFAGMDAVVHLAALISICGDPDGLVMRTNVEGTRNVVAACLSAKVARLVHLSSIHAFRIAKTDRFVDETHPPADASCFPYDRSKMLGERAVLAGVEKGLDATVLNPTGVLGPFDFAPSRAGMMLEKLFAGGMRILVEGGFDWVDARDVSRAVANAITRRGAGERYLLAGHWVSFRELAALCDAVTGKSVTRWAVPVVVARLGLPFSLLADRLSGREPLFTGESLAIVDHGRWTGSSAKAERALAYTARPLPETLADTYIWLRARR